MYLPTKPMLLTGLISAVALSTVPLYGDEAKEEPRSQEDVASEAVKADTRGQVISSFKLGDDKDATKIEIYALPDGFGGDTFGILEAKGSGLGREDLPFLNSVTNPRELVHAFAKHGDEESPLLVANFDEPKMGRAGWARDAVKLMPKDPVSERAVCSWNSFKNSFNSYQPQVNGTKYWYSNVNGYHDTAQGQYYTYPFPHTTWRNYVSNGSLYPWNNVYNNYRFYNVDKFKSKVRVCKYQNGNAYQDRFIQFRYRNSNNSVGIAATVNLDSSKIGYTYSWQWTPSNTNLNYDWVTLVGGSSVWGSGYYSHPDDKFYVAMQKK